MAELITITLGERTKQIFDEPPAVAKYKAAGWDVSASTLPTGDGGEAEPSKPKSKGRSNRASTKDDPPADDGEGDQ